MTHALEPTHDPRALDVDAIVQVLDRLTDGDYLQSVGDESPVMQALGRLLTHLATEGGRDLRRAVSLSMQASETTILAANLLLSLRNVDGQAHSIAAAAEEMQASALEIRRNGDRINDEAKAARDATSEGTRAVQSSHEAFDGLARSVQDNVDKVHALASLTRRVQDAADDIKAIAFQTNLLSLNASVEAARAGAAGAGFAVVAAEVRNLSGRAALATKEISSIVRLLEEGMSAIVTSMAHSSAAVTASRSVIDEVGTHMSTIRARTETVTDNTQQILSTLQEQSVASHDVAQGITIIAGSTSEGVRHVDEIVDALNRTEALVRDQLDGLAKKELKDKVLQLAQSDHVLWKKRLANMVAGKEGLRAEELADHHSCRLGKWYDAVKDPAMRGRAAFGALVAPHKQVHAAGIEAVRRFNRGDVEGALQAIEQVEDASADVLRLLGALEAKRPAEHPGLRVAHPKR
jgi:methyl-accepting chemotaxis protein